MKNTNIIFFDADIMSLDLLSLVFLLSVLCGIYVIISNNPILSVLYLIGLFFTVSIYLILLGLHFIGLSYLLIYVGAISMLFIFILMLINIRVSELFTDNRNSILLAILTIISVNFSIGNTLPGIQLSLYITEIMNNLLSFQFTINVQDYSKLVYENLLSINLINIAAKSWDSTLVTITHISSMGNILYTNLFMLFILTSIILLLAMVGAIVITINKSTKIFSEPKLPKHVTVLRSDPLFDLLQHYASEIHIRPDNFSLDEIRPHINLTDSGPELLAKLKKICNDTNSEYLDKAKDIKKLSSAYERKIDIFQSWNEHNNVRVLHDGNQYKLTDTNNNVITQGQQNAAPGGPTPTILSGDVVECAAKQVRDCNELSREMAAQSPQFIFLKAKLIRMYKGLGNERMASYVENSWDNSNFSKYYKYQVYKHYYSGLSKKSTPFAVKTFFNVRE